MSISIVVPVYNVERYIKECIDSLINQTISADEIILVDDGSTDESGNICDEYSFRYSYIKTIHKCNAGLGMARNTGLEYVSSDYVTFFDSDDFADKDYIEKLMKPIIEDNYDTCKSSFKRVDMNSNYIQSEDIFTEIYNGEHVQSELLPRLIGSAADKKDSVPMSSCSTIYSMKIIKDHKLQFVSERDWISEDIIFNIEYYSYAKNVILIDYIGYNYRINPKSLTTKYMPDRFEKCKVMYFKEAELLKNKGIYDICEMRLNRQFFIYIRKCISQLKRDVSGLSRAQVVNEIRKICSDTLVKNIVKSYPLHMLDTKPKIFLKLVKNNAALILYTLYDKFNIH